MVKKLVAPLALILLASASFGYSGDKVFLAKNGTKYHLSKTCPALKNAKDVHEVSMSMVRSKHITMCDLCKAAKAKAAKPMMGTKPKAASKMPAGMPGKSAPKTHSGKATSTHH